VAVCNRQTICDKYAYENEIYIMTGRDLLINNVYAMFYEWAPVYKLG
jgi:hypothetical protein